MKEPIPGSLAWEAQQLVHAVEALHQKPEEKKDTPMCPKCGLHHRIYDSKGRLMTYCLECKHVIDKARYASLKTK